MGFAKKNGLATLAGLWHYVPVAEPTLGRVIKERYILREQLGRGGMGAVWRAEDLHLHIDVAVKLIDPNNAESPEARARFEREALAAAQLRSRHIVLTTDHGVDGETPFIVMEFLRGESLAKRLHREGRFPFEQVLEWFSQIADALGMAHDQRIVHRDLKPDNVFIVQERSKEFIKVLDFGVAKKLDAQSFGDKIKTHTGTLLGTPYYMSPEQSRGVASVDHRTDLWSFGVMAYECLTGRRPFEGSTLPDLLMAICRDPYLPPSQVALVPRGFDDWFARATAREPRDRFDSAEQAFNHLCALSGEPLIGGPDVRSVNPTTTAPNTDDQLQAQAATAIIETPAELGASAMGAAKVHAQVVASAVTATTPAAATTDESIPAAEASPVGCVRTRSVAMGEGSTASSAVAHSFMPSSITNRSQPTNLWRARASRTLWSALALAVVGLGYGLWRASYPAVADHNVLNENPPAIASAQDASAHETAVQSDALHESERGRDVTPDSVAVPTSTSPLAGAAVSIAGPHPNLGDEARRNAPVRSSRSGASTSRSTSPSTYVPKNKPSPKNPLGF